MARDTQKQNEQASYDKKNPVPSGQKLRLPEGQLQIRARLQIAPTIVVLRKHRQRSYTAPNATSDIPAQVSAPGARNEERSTDLTCFRNASTEGPHCHTQIERAHPSILLIADKEIDKASSGGHCLIRYTSPINTHFSARPPTLSPTFNHTENFDMEKDNEEQKLLEGTLQVVVVEGDTTISGTFRFRPPTDRESDTKRFTFNLKGSVKDIMRYSLSETKTNTDNAKVYYQITEDLESLGHEKRTFRAKLFGNDITLHLSDSVKVTGTVNRQTGSPVSQNGEVEDAAAGVAHLKAEIHE
ncbi:hypothetical protein SISNIDRAFT_464613 [Sistotremastrum niveocremeum HHB9708]|uniref:Uncharacterized protein n=1 Tax=Sistotremastrum niveocremeum HHB9708 TaxID=1314777 RepID=A0A164X483_9AGAM|nr:hypothetical protein SISNIDRAFT_464613 [Sistotremastrum niveocremeum HHB9708]